MDLSLTGQGLEFDPKCCLATSRQLISQWRVSPLIIPILTLHQLPYLALSTVVCNFYNGPNLNFNLSLYYEKFRIKFRSLKKLQKNVFTTKNM